MFGKKTLKIAAALGTALMLAACATTADDGQTDIDTTARNNTNTNSGPAGPAAGSIADFEQNVGNRVFFAYDQWTLTPQAQAVLARQAGWMRQYPEKRFLVAGNCDERGTREYNLALGARRAEAVKSYLVSLGVDRARLTTVSNGKEKPIDPRSNESAWSLNRNATTGFTN